MAWPLFKRLNVSRRSRWFQAVVISGSIALCLAVAFIFWVQPDVCAAILVLPRWLWIFPGLLFGLLGWTRESKRFALIALGLWILYTLFFIQEWHSLFRFQSVVEKQPIVRVISL